jgi:hypothetical protein
MDMRIELQSIAALLKSLRHSTYICSWTASQIESFVLWKMYAREKLGVAIRTTWNELRKAFEQTEQNIHIGEVMYYDNENPVYKIGNTFYTIITNLNRKYGVLRKL